MLSHPTHPVCTLPAVEAQESSVPGLPCTTLPSSTPSPSTRMPQPWGEVKALLAQNSSVLLAAFN